MSAPKMNTRKSQKDNISTPARATRAKSADRIDRGNITVSDLVDDIMAKGEHIGTPKSNPNSPLTMGLMMELLKKMEANTVEQVKFACAIISRIRELVSHSRT